VYFFFRAEKLQRTIILLKRETTKTLKEKELLAKSMVQMAGNTEGFAINRLQVLLKKHKDEEILDQLILIKPFLDNYSLIFNECLMKKGKLQSTTKKCFSNREESYKDFFEQVIKKDSKIQRLWNSNNFIGFISLAEALLVKYEGQAKTDNALKDTLSEELS
jgi:hypothetical protein